MNLTSQTKFDIREEFKEVPRWAISLAAFFFVALPVILLLVAFPHDRDAPPLLVQVLIGLFGASVLAFFALLIGYVNCDAKRRGMNYKLWTALVIFIPNAIGYIIYFVVRQPIRGACPQCGATTNPTFNFCPKCKFNLHPACPQCHRAIEVGATFCPYCSAELRS